MTRTALATLTAVLALAAAPAPPAAGQTYPPPRPLATEPVPEVPRPGYLETITDPVFDTEVTRISSRAAFDDTSDAQRHAYSKIQPWNSDGSLLLLGYNYPAPLLDGETYEFLRQVRQPSEALWSNTDPELMYGERRNKFISWDVTTEESEVLHTFSAYRQVAIGYGEGNLSDDDRYVTLVGRRPSGKRDLISFDITADEVIATRSIGRHSIDNVTSSRSGDWIVANWNRNGTGRHEGIELFTQDLEFERQLTKFGNHADIGWLPSGGEAFVTYHPKRRASLAAIPLEGGPQIVIADNAPGLSGGHVSCRAYERPGYCVWSDTGSSGELAFDQTFAFPLEPEPLVEVFAHQHHRLHTPYAHEAHGVPSRDGSTVLFASSWEGGANAHPLAYVARYP